MIAEIFCISSTQEVIFYKKYEHDTIPHNKSIDIFCSRIAESRNQEILPTIQDDGIYYYHILRGNLYFVASSTATVSASIQVLEILVRLYQLCKDFCGMVTEDGLQSNILLIHELLNEFICDGYVQLAVTEKLRQYILTNPVTVKAKTPDNLSSGLFGVEYKNVSENTHEKPVVQPRTQQEQRKSEVFVDVIERLTVLIDNKGQVARNEIHGKINLKCFLLGTPTVLLGLNSDLTVGRTNIPGYGPNVHITNYSFHDCVKTDLFEEKKILTIHPPQGEFCSMNYSHQGELSGGLPFILLHHLNQNNDKEFELSLNLKSNIPTRSQAIKIRLTIPVPASSTSVSHQFNGPGQKFIFSSKDKKMVWEIKKLNGGMEIGARFKIVTSGENASLMDVGPVTMDFEISGFVCTNLQVRFLQVQDQGKLFMPFQWVRYITIPDSYTFKIT
ncbi:AP-4 complex subunit mu-1-like isoform X2 [Tubulanus polymorphus]|uniref:AP-4 complex subunit mu-1-like isoform X2 n=1 Tax=Tubulanus polymorphus TaxID=672921 RepID=UPI003DA572C3